MQRKLMQTFLFLLIFVFIAVLPATAEEIKLNLSGQPASFVDMYMENGVTMIGLNSFAKLSGAQIDSSVPNSLSISKGNINLVIALDKRDALLNEKTIQLPSTPIKSGEEIYIPLRFICNLFGYEVKWDNTNATVELTIHETKDGMTPQELIAKASQASQEINTYSLDGSYTINMAISGDGHEQMNINGLTTTMKGQIQNQPLQTHLIQTMEFPGLPSQDDSQMIIETYMTEEKMYFKFPEQPWTVQDMPISPEFWQQQQNLQSNPLEAAAQVNELGGILSFSDDTVVDDKEYYVVNAVVNMDNFRDSYQQIMQQVMGSMPLPSSESEKIEQIMEQFLQEAKIDYYYKSFINKQTFLNDIVKLDMNLDFSLDLTDLADSGSSPDMPQTIHMKMNMQGQFRIKDVGKPFIAPDVKDAVPFLY